MAKPKKDDEMQTTALKIQLPPLPLPQKEEKRLMQAEVNQNLFDAAEKEMAKRKLKIRQVMEWALSAFLFVTNPKEALRLGIKMPDVPGSNGSKGQ